MSPIFTVPALHRLRFLPYSLLDCPPTFLGPPFILHGRLGPEVVLGRDWPEAEGRPPSGVGAGCLFFLRAESGFLGGCVEDMGIVSAVTVSGTWADCGVIGASIKDVTTQGGLCVLVKGGMRRRYG